MKKSQLRNIIKESIREIIEEGPTWDKFKEQVNCCLNLNKKCCPLYPPDVEGKTKSEIETLLKTHLESLNPINEISWCWLPWNYNSEWCRYKRRIKKN